MVLLLVRFFKSFILFCNNLIDIHNQIYDLQVSSPILCLLHWASIDMTFKKYATSPTSDTGRSDWNIINFDLLKESHIHSILLLGIFYSINHFWLADNFVQVFYTLLICWPFVLYNIKIKILTFSSIISFFLYFSSKVCFFFVPCIQNLLLCVLKSRIIILSWWIDPFTL